MKNLCSVLVVGLLFAMLLLGGCVPVAEGEETGFNWTTIFIVLALVALFYFLMIRPVRKRQKDQQKMVAELKTGDKVIAAGGIYGEIESLDEESAVLKTESGAKIRVAKQGVMVRHISD